MGMSDVEVAVHAAALAAGVAASHLRESLEIEYKGAYSDPVTDADREAEQAVRDFLAQERPADGVIGEELVDKPGKRQWLVDPIDGTVNYLRGNAYWCSAVALVDAGRAVASAVHATDGPTSFTAEHHRGAWRNGNPLDLDTAGRLDEAVLATYIHSSDLACDTYRRLLSTAATCRVKGSGTLDLVGLASGEVDAWVQRDVSPWDWVPGALVVTEAGGAAVQLVTACGEWAVAGSATVVDDMTTQLRAVTCEYHSQDLA